MHSGRVTNKPAFQIAVCLAALNFAEMGSRGESHAPGLDASQDNVLRYANALKPILDRLMNGECDVAAMLAGTDLKLRGVEFEYLETVSKSCQASTPTRTAPGISRPRIPGEVNVVSADPTRKQAALPLMDGTLRTINLDTLAHGVEIRTAFSTGSPLIIGSYSSDGTTYAVGAENGRVYVWRPGEPGDPSVLPLGDKPVINAALNKNGTRLVAEMMTGDVGLWDVPNQKKITVLGKSFVHGRTASFSPDGKMIALAGLDNVEIFSADTGFKVKEIGPHAYYIMNIAFSPDGTLLALGARGDFAKSIALFDLETGRKIAQCEGHKNGITGLVFTPDGKRLVSTSGDGTIRFWHVPGGIELLSLFVGDGFGDPQFSNDGRALIWSGKRGLELIQLDRQARAEQAP